MLLLLGALPDDIAVGLEMGDTSSAPHKTGNAFCGT
jgi:hypothetical protein